MQNASGDDEIIRSAVAGDKVALQSLLLMHYSEIETQFERIEAPSLPPNWKFRT
jgi:hypothetical protein